MSAGSRATKATRVVEPKSTTAAEPDADGQYFGPLLVEFAVAAGKVLKRRFARTLRVTRKGIRNLVTQADLESEEFLAEKILARFPVHSLLTEETHSREGVSEYRWVIDPLDGTNNFAHGIPHYAVSIALQLARTTIAAAVYDPSKRETFSATLGGGAFRNGKPIGVSKTATLIDALVATGFAYNRATDADTNVPSFGRVVMATRDVRRMGAASLDLCYVAMGRFDGFFELALQPWDTMAGNLIVREAGGLVTDYKGKPHTGFETQVLATNGRIHDSLCESVTGARA